MARIFGAYGVACVQGAADVLTLALAVPVMLNTRKFIDETERRMASSEVSV